MALHEKVLKLSKTRRRKLAEHFRAVANGTLTHAAEIEARRNAGMSDNDNFKSMNELESRDVLETLTDSLLEFIFAIGFESIAEIDVPRLTASLVEYAQSNLGTIDSELAWLRRIARDWHEVADDILKIGTSHAA